MNSIKSAIFLIIILSAQRINAQTYVGICVNAGNSLSYSPESDGLASPPAISGGILLMKQETISEKWALQYGFGLGVLGYKLKINSTDTITAPGPPSTFSEYSTFYGKFHLQGARIIDLKTKELLIGFGGGLSYFFSFIESTNYGIGTIFPGNSSVELFSSDITSPSTSILPFIKVTTQLKLNFHFTIGLEYTYHFNSMLEGTYEFYHTSTPASGNISLNPKEISLTLFVKISKF